MSKNSDSDSSIVDSDSSVERPINRINKNNAHKNESELIALNSTNYKLNTDQAQSSFGNIALDKSSNITVGNKNEYYGPVIIKQYHNKQNNFTPTSINCKQITETPLVQDKNVTIYTKVSSEHLEHCVIGEDNCATVAVDTIVSSCKLLPYRVRSLIGNKESSVKIFVSFCVIVLSVLVTSITWILFKNYHAAALNSHSGNNTKDGKNEFKQNISCENVEWKCNDGDCISIYAVCDGIYNCKDESDETISTCYNYRCPLYKLRCPYGACVDSDSECNGQQDCVDNSDELALNCPGVKESLSLKGNCSDYQFQCDNGECIQEYSLCDGATDCKDASDETFKRCSNIFCPSFGFRCGYGGCVSGTAKCDGNNDCADGSDEENLLCNYKTKPITPVIPTTVGGSCTIIQLPLHGKASYKGQLNTQFKIGDAIEEFSTIVYRCDIKYLLSGDDTNFCIGGMWSNKVPTCKKYCSNIPLFTFTIKAECELNGMPISCEQKLLPETIARLRCKDGYRKPNTTINDLLRCDSEGQWDYSPFRCEQICGIDGSESGVQYIVGGEKKNIKVPWHVGIYSNIGKNNQFTQICGGTILNAKVIITAAHCFWDQSTEGFYDKKYFQVVAGKYYRDYYAVEPLKTQTFTIDKFQSIQGYNDETDKFNNDIALLVLDKFIEFRSYITPICVDWNSSWFERYVRSGWRGRVAGWRSISYNDELIAAIKVFELPTVEYIKCKVRSTPVIKPYIIVDKFCAVFSDTEVSVCKRDSGGGLVIPKKSEDGETKYFLLGIVSTGAIKAGSCDNNKYATFTNIQYQISFIGKIESEYRPK